MPRLPDYQYKLENLVEQNIRRVFKDLAPDLNIEIAHDIYDTIFYILYNIRPQTRYSFPHWPKKVGFAGTTQQTKIFVCDYAI